MGYLEGFTKRFAYSDGNETLSNYNDIINELNRMRDKDYTVSIGLETKPKTVYFTVYMTDRPVGEIIARGLTVRQTIAALEDIRAGKDPQDRIREVQEAEEMERNDYFKNQQYALTTPIDNVFRTDPRMKAFGCRTSPFTRNSNGYNVTFHFDGFDDIPVIFTYKLYPDKKEVGLRIFGKMIVIASNIKNRDKLFEALQRVDLSRFFPEEMLGGQHIDFFLVFVETVMQTLEQGRIAIVHRVSENEPSGFVECVDIDQERAMMEHLNLGPTEINNFDRNRVVSHLTKRTEIKGWPRITMGGEGFFRPSGGIVILHFTNPPHEFEYKISFGGKEKEITRIEVGTLDFATTDGKYLTEPDLRSAYGSGLSGAIMDLMMREEIEIEVDPNDEDANDRGFPPGAIGGLMDDDWAMGWKANCILAIASIITGYANPSNLYSLGYKMTGKRVQPNPPTFSLLTLGKDDDHQERPMLKRLPDIDPGNSLRMNAEQERAMMVHLNKNTKKLYDWPTIVMGEPGFFGPKGGSLVILFENKPINIEYSISFSPSGKTAIRIRKVKAPLVFDDVELKEALTFLLRQGYTERVLGSLTNELLVQTYRDIRDKASTMLPNVEDAKRILINARYSSKESLDARTDEAVLRTFREYEAYRTGRALHEEYTFESISYDHALQNIVEDLEKDVYEDDDGNVKYRKDSIIDLMEPEWSVMQMAKFIINIAAIVTLYANPRNIERFRKVMESEDIQASVQTNEEMSRISDQGRKLFGDTAKPIHHRSVSPLRKELSKAEMIELLSTNGHNVSVKWSLAMVRAAFSAKMPESAN